MIFLRLPIMTHKACFVDFLNTLLLLLLLLLFSGGRCVCFGSAHVCMFRSDGNVLEFVLSTTFMWLLGLLPAEPPLWSLAHVFDQQCINKPALSSATITFPSLLFLPVRKRWMNRLSISSAYMRVVPRALVETFFCCRDNILGQKQLTKGLCCLAAPGDSLSGQGSHDRSLKQLVSHPAPIIRSREP